MDYDKAKGPRTSDVIGTILLVIVGGGGALYLLVSVFPPAVAILIAFIGVYVFALSR